MVCHKRGESDGREKQQGEKKKKKKGKKKVIGPPGGGDKTFKKRRRLPAWSDIFHAAWTSTAVEGKAAGGPQRDGKLLGKKRTRE